MCIGKSQKINAYWRRNSEEVQVASELPSLNSRKFVILCKFCFIAYNYVKTW